MIETVLIVILTLSLIFNIIFYIPYLLKKQDEKLSIHFKELQLRLNRLENNINKNDGDLNSKESTTL